MVNIPPYYYIVNSLYQSILLLFNHNVNKKTHKKHDIGIYSNKKIYAIVSPAIQNMIFVICEHFTDQNV